MFFEDLLSEALKFMLPPREKVASIYRIFFAIFKEKTSLICEKISLIKTLFFKIEAFFSLDVRKNKNKYYLSLKLFSINFSLRIEYLR